MIWIYRNVDTAAQIQFPDWYSAVFMIRDGADDLSEQSRELPAGGEGSTAAGAAKPGQCAGRWIQKIHFMTDKCRFPHLCVYCPPRERKHNWKQPNANTGQDLCGSNISEQWMHTYAIAGDVLLQVPVCQHGLSSQSHKAMRPKGHHATEPCTRVMSQFLLWINSELAAPAFLSWPPKSRVVSFLCVSDPIYGSCLQTWSRS